MSRLVAVKSALGLDQEFESPFITDEEIKKLTDGYPDDKSAVNIVGEEIIERAYRKCLSLPVPLRAGPLEYADKMRHKISLFRIENKFKGE